jgi:hypothetical protein
MSNKRLSNLVQVMRTGLLCWCWQSPSPVVVFCAGADTTLDRNFAFGEFVFDELRQARAVRFYFGGKGLIVRLHQTAERRLFGVAFVRGDGVGSAVKRRQRRAVLRT